MGLLREPDYGCRRSEHRLHFSSRRGCGNQRFQRGGGHREHLPGRKRKHGRGAGRFSQRRGCRWVVVKRWSRVYVWYRDVVGWDDSSPPTGQGGFGVSKFFPSPPYQVGLTTSALRSVPDVVANADPASGFLLCQASTGGCPNGLLYGGTSVAAPTWAAFTAVLNEALGHNLGTFNRSIYPFANTTAFHNAASLGSDFAHVGLGSPNLSQLYLKLGGIALGAPDANLSTSFPFIETPLTPSHRRCSCGWDIPGFRQCRAA